MTYISPLLGDIVILPSQLILNFQLLMELRMLYSKFKFNENPVKTLLQEIPRNYKTPAKSHKITPDPA